MSNLSVKRNLQAFEKKYVKREIKDTEEIPMVQLDRNENNFGFSPKVPQAIAENISSSYVYTNVDGEPLRSKLAEFHKVSVENILIGNGSFELIGLIAQVFQNKGKKAIQGVPTFDWYRIATILNHGEMIDIPLENHHYPLEEIARNVTDDVEIIWLCNPNNPTGTFFTKKDLVEFLEKIPSSKLVVVDEAYIDFVPDEVLEDNLSLLEKYENLLFLRTFSKIYGLASLRVGYAIANPSIIHSLFQFKIPPNTNRLSVMAAAASLQDVEHYGIVKEKVASEKRFYEEELTKRGFYFIPSYTNFLLIDFGKKTDEIVRQFAKEGILLRGGSEFGYDHFIRVTIGKHQENKLFFEVLDKISLEE
ncbi:histidinol-phosphate aminotransferase [Pilibacter termitis]|uniref:Histidinol-phosphate aminotransferase n=1 Tax=Pilibacter termitis TaxID=263852 RepID=A0A1T4QCX0_9ENTE|nr:histidinol-phosphate transaminase [Pilibacter termitis]SKA01534.1 histidinol-phosphate aminotransferase [Pilibacter termitis]